MELVKSKGIGLEILDTDKKIDGEVAWTVAQLIDQADGDIRLAKGKFWNLCEHGTRAEISEAFGWKTDTMLKYAQYARELETCSTEHISFTHWRNLYAVGIKSADRPAWLDRASDNKWTPKQLTGAAEKHLEDEEKAKLERRAQTLAEKSNKTIEEARKKVEDDEKVAQAEKSAKAYRKKYEKAKAIVSEYEQTKLTDSGEIEVVDYTDAEDAIKVLYRFAMKAAHTDVNGNQDSDDAIKVNRAKEVIDKYIKYTW